MYLSKIRRKTGFSYERNVALRLVLSLSGFYIGLQALYIIVMVLSDNQASALSQVFLPQVALQDWNTFLQKPWTIVSYLLYHQGFFEFATNMVWLYLFSMVIQTLVGYKEVLPIYIISTLLGGILFLLLATLTSFSGTKFVAGSYAGIAAMGTACFVLAPKYKVYVAERFSFPIWLALIIYFGLNTLMFFPNNSKMMVLLAIGVFIGATYMLLLKNGVALGKKIYDIVGGIFKKAGANPEINKEGASSSKMVLNEKNDVIDNILDKIHQKGILSLSSKEKEILENFSNKI